MVLAADVIAAIATPPGRGGIGVVRVSGPDLSRVVEGVVGHPLQPRMATLASFLDARGEVLDQGLALWFPAPASYTGEAVLELQGHGGPAVLGLILNRCVELGARLAEPGEFTKRAFLNDKLDLAQAEGVADLIDAATGTAARAAARSLSGAFSRQVTAIVAALVELRMFTEATLDFPEEDIDFIRADQPALTRGFVEGYEYNQRLHPVEDAGQWLTGLQSVAAWVAAVRAHGGDVVFVRTPTSGKLRELEDAAYPRAIYWVRLSAATGAATIHSDDVSGLKSINLPDGSHVDMHDKPAYTRALVDALAARGLVQR